MTSPELSAQPGAALWPSHSLTSLPLVQDYAGAWTAERGRCHRFVYVDSDGRPANCPESTVTSGWRRDGQDRWHVVDACARHSSQLLSQPRADSFPGATMGRTK